VTVCFSSSSSSSFLAALLLIQLLSLRNISRYLSSYSCEGGNAISDRLAVCFAPSTGEFKDLFDLRIF
jgi:hypothetical protein